MDVNIMSRTQEYLKNYAVNDNTSQYVTAQSDVVQSGEFVENSQKSANQNKDDKKNGEYTKEDLDKSIKKLNKFLEDDKTHAEYEKHKELGTIMIKIVDETTDKVILEVPPKKILDMVAKMCEQVGIIDKKA